jgi:hypothetical protein
MTPYGVIGCERVINALVDCFIATKAVHDHSHIKVFFCAENEGRHACDSGHARATQYSASTVLGTDPLAYSMCQNGATSTPLKFERPSPMKARTHIILITFT